jgi:hypothetical protein
VTRAYQLALECSSVEKIRTKLIREDYEDVDEHLQGAALRRELNAKQARDSKESGGCA